MLLATKLFVPRPPARAVVRRRLLDRLEGTGAPGLTLVSAPAGFGKTALVAGWVREHEHPAAWLSLDDGDDEPGRFWAYLIEALRRGSGAAVAESALQLLQSPQPPAPETIATIVINELAAIPHELVCVLDDYHVVSAEPIHRSVVLLVEHMPPNARLVVTTRADPPWPLARLRAGARMTELRAADLRFTEDEASAFLESAGLALSSDDIRALECRTEGWIAGLQMAVLSIRDRSDTADFIHDFAGSHRFVLDYLAQEVLDHQPETTRRFLALTSILEQLNGDLCDAVTGLGHGQEILETLERTNLFTEPLDDERRWYRYHQLFADVLRSQLSALDRDLLLTLHRRASEWFEQEGLEVEAVHHALAAHDVERATRLIARAASATFMVGNQLLVLEWIRRLPGEAIAATPGLALVDAWARFVTGDWEGVVPALETAGRAIGSAAASSEREALEAQLDGIRSWVAYQTGDLDACVALASAALPRIPEDGLVPRRIVASAQGYGLLLVGETEAALAVAADTAAESRSAGDALTECLAIALEGQAHLSDGRLASAARAYERAIAAGTVGGEPLPSVAIARVQLAEVLRERGELDEAERVLRASIAACEEALGLPEWVFEGNVTLARVLAARGDREGSREAAERAERALAEEILPGGMEPIVGRALGYRVRHWLAAGETARAAAWLAGQGVSAGGELAASSAPLSLLLAKTLVADGKHEPAGLLVERLLAAAGDTAGLGHALELTIVRALTRQAAGREAEATESIVEALRAAEPEGYLRLFVDEGEPMLRLLERAARALPGRAAYARRLADALRRGHGGRADTAAAAGVRLREPLSERELGILRLLAVGRSNREIAEELFLSVNTVKWHARKLYGKLGVTGRALAVARARELGIL